MTPPISNRARLMPASPIRKLMPLADEAKRPRRACLPPQHRPARPARRPSRCDGASHELRDRSSPTRRRAGRREYLGTLRRYYARAGDRARDRRDPRHHRRQRGAALRVDGLRRRRRRGAGRRAVLHELQRLRDDGRRAPRAADAAAAKTAFTCPRARPGTRRSRRARGWWCSATPATRLAPSTPAKSWRWSPEFCREHGSS